MSLKHIIENGLCGNKHIIELIRNIKQNKNSAHAFLFYGPENVGKETFAKYLALTLNCSQNDSPCFKCLNCQKILNNSFEYFNLLKYNFGEIPINDIRDKIISKCLLKVPENIKNIFVINDAKYFNVESANCFLKTLEEPILNVIFILITSNVNEIIATIRSRCQLVKFNEISHSEITSYIKNTFTFNLPVDILNFIIDIYDSIGNIISLFNSKDYNKILENIKNCYLSIKNNDLSINKLIDLIEIVYEDINIDTENEKMLQLEKQFDKIEFEFYSRYGLKVIMIHWLLYFGICNLRREFQVLCYKIIESINIFFENIEKNLQNYIISFKESLPTATLNDLNANLKREINAKKKNEYLQITSLMILILKRVYILKFDSKYQTNKNNELKSFYFKIAKSLSYENLEKIINELSIGYFKDLMCNINTDLYFERCAFIILENIRN